MPCTFAIDESGRIVIGVDSKPKATRNLRRLRNIGQNPRVSLLADDYDEDWNQLWWARADGVASIENDGAEHGPTGACCAASTRNTTARSWTVP